MANIPIADKHEDAAINQHLVPKCYMKEWAYNPKKSSVWFYQRDKEGKETDVDIINISYASKQIRKINAIDNYYDIKAGCYFMPQEALDEIFGPTMHLKVVLDGINLDTEKKRNEKFGLLNEWIVYGENGNAITEEEKADLKKYFDEARFVFIEKEWNHQYENNWRTYISNFYNKILQTKDGVGCNIVDGKKVSTFVTEEMISEIIKLLIVFDIRGFSSDEYINEQINSIFDRLPSEIFDMELEPEDRMHPIETTVRECFRHQFILHLCYDILKGNQLSGIVKKIWDGYKEHLIPRFCLTDINHPFVTSERPVFMNVFDNGKKEHIFVALPTMLIAMGRGEKGQFLICNLSSDEVDDYNRIIAKNNQFIISCDNNLDVYKIWG